MKGDTMDRRLKQFLAVAETGNVSAAAEAMRVSQPTVSVNIKRLEDEYGVRLFTRSSRGVVLTEFGKVLYEHVRVMSRLNDQASAELRALKQINRPTLKVGCGFSWWQPYVRPALCTMMQNHPDAGIHIDICSSYDGLRSLLTGDITCFIGSRVDNLRDQSAFRFQKLFDIDDAYFARADHPLQGRDVTLAELADFPQIDVAPFVNRHFGLSDMDQSAQTAKRVTAQLSCNSMTSGIGLLQDTDAYLFYPTTSTAFFADRGIHPLRVRDCHAGRVDIGVYALAEKPDSVLQTAFVDLVCAAVDG